MRTQVYFEDGHKDALLGLAERRGMAYSKVFRRALGIGIEKLLGEEKTYKFNREAWKKFMGAGGKSGDKNLSKNIDKILYVDPYK